MGAPKLKRFPTEQKAIQGKDTNKEDKVIIETLRNKISEKLKNKQNAKKAAQILLDLMDSTTANKK